VITEEKLRYLQRNLTDRGKLIEAGWIGLRLAALPLDAPKCQIDEMRNAFMAGAQYLFSAIMTILDPGDEPTEKDLDRMSLIQDELDEVIKDYGLRHTVTAGRS
jgi:hypothetical protein